MPELVYRGQTYRLRAGTPMPTSRAGEFVLHTFMAELSDIDIYACTENLPSSSQFRGQGGTFMSANFSRLNVKGGNIFSGKIVHAPQYVDEDTIV